MKHYSEKIGWINAGDVYVGIASGQVYVVENVFRDMVRVRYGVKRREHTYIAVNHFEFMFERVGSV